MRRIGIGSKFLWTGRLCPIIACDICRLSADSEPGEVPEIFGGCYLIASSRVITLSFRVLLPLTLRCNVVILKVGQKQNKEAKEI